MVKIGKYTYSRSTKKGKKLMTVVNGKTIHFGDISMEHFKDKTNLLPKRLNHNDKDRRKNYLTRSAGIKDKSGKLTTDKVFYYSPFSQRIFQPLHIF